MYSTLARILAGIFAMQMILSSAALAGDDNSKTAPDTRTDETGSPARKPSGTAKVGRATDPLLQLLLTKGVLSTDEVNSLAMAPAVEMRNRLLLLLKAKGILSAADLNALEAQAGSGAADASTEPLTPGETGRVSPGASLGSPDVALGPQQSGPPQPPTSVSRGPVSAVVPIRPLQVQPAKREGVIPAISIGKNVHVQPYGFFKSSVVYDTESPYGNDFPLPGFIGDVNGPDKISEFHLKARALRLGSNFEWLDIAPNLIVTGKLEVDFEGNFSRVNNRNISSIRSNAPQIRLGFARIDWNATDKTSLNFLAGQDWTPFGSSTLPNLFETTGLGIGFGTLYERAPQFRFGVSHKFKGSFSIEPDVAVVLPAFGNLPANVADQLGDGERQGTDSARPEIQARLVAQFQLDHAANVPPAQIIVSGVDSARSVVVLASAVPTAFKTAFPSGTRIDSSRKAWTAEVQLPTRFATIIAKYYNGSDLRYFFAGQILGPFNDTTGLTNTATAPSIDGSSTLVFGLRSGVPVVASSLPVRAQGGFVNVGLPLSRWASADPNGRNAGWVMYLHYGFDQALARDVRRLGGGRQKGDLAATTLQYKLNNFVTFVAEESLYRTRAIPLTATGQFPLFRGRPMREMNDVRTEIGPIFTF